MQVGRVIPTNGSLPGGTAVPPSLRPKKKLPHGLVLVNRISFPMRMLMLMLLRCRCNLHDPYPFACSPRLELRSGHFCSGSKVVVFPCPDSSSKPRQGSAANIAAMMLSLLGSSIALNCITAKVWSSSPGSDVTGLHNKHVGRGAYSTTQPLLGHFIKPRGWSNPNPACC